MIIMVEKIPIKPLEELKFGKTLLASDLECLNAYLVYCHGDHGAVAPTTHQSYIWLTAAKTAFAAISSISLPSGINATATHSVALRNLARIARLKLEGDGLIRFLNQLSDQLALLPDGNICTTKTISDTYIDVARFICGQDMTGFIGTWDNQKYAIQDEIIGGIFIIAFYIGLWWNLHLSSILDILHSIGEFTKDNASMRGSYKPFLSSDPKTWGAILVAQENSTASAVFGMSTAQLDDPTLRSITVCKVAGAEKIMNKLLSPSQWTWRFGRWIRVKPVYFMWNPETTETGDGSIFTDWASSVLLFNDSGANKWRSFNSDFNEFINDLKSFYFKNKSYADLKSQFTFVPFGDLPVPAVSGNGGILGFQMMHWVDGGAISTDTLMHKFLADSDDRGHLTLMCRREFNSDKRFLMLGDIEVDEYRLHVALQATNVDDQAHSPVEPATFGVFHSPVCLKSFFGFGIGKTEDEPYKLGRVIYDGVAIVNAASGLQGKSVAPLTWVPYTNTDDVTFPISLYRDKTLFKYGRSADPFKKLRHQVVDINELDVDAVLKTANSYIFPVKSASSIESSPIAVSASVEAELQIPNLGGEQKKVSDDVNTPAETNVAASIPVSATVQSATKDLSQAKADVKKAEAEVKKEKAKDK